MNCVCVRKLAGFTGEGLGVAFADFEVPICFSDGQRREHGNVKWKTGKTEIFLLVLLSPPALAGTLSGSLIIFAA